MIMRKLLFALCGFAALGLSAATIQPAEAQPYYPGYGRHYGPPPGPYGRPYPRPAYGWGGPGYRPAYGYGYRRAFYPGPRCWVRPERVWTPYGWARRPVRVCR